MDIQHHLVFQERFTRRGPKGMRSPGLCEPGHDESPFNVVRLLRACTLKKDLHKGSKLHAYVREHKHLGENTYVGNTLVSMYAKCGALAKAQSVLKELPFRDVVSWTALIAGHAQQGQGEEALRCFDYMLHDGHSPNAVTFICILKACGSIRAAAKGEEIHENIVTLGMLQKSRALGNTLVDMYVKCGALAKAYQVLQELPMRNVVSWNALIAGYTQQGQGEEALKCFDDMLDEGHSPDAVTFACVLKACGSIRAAAKAEVIYEKIVSMGMLEKDIVLGNALVDLYAKCGALAKAYEVLKELPMRDVVSWSTLILGYAQKGQGEEALKCFDDMLCEGHTPDAVTFSCVLKACGSIEATAKGEEIHEKVISMGMLESNIVLGNALVDMYAKCGALAKAHQVLKELPMCDVVAWSSLIAGYVQQGQGQEALKCFDEMLCKGHSPNAVTFTCILKACGRIRAAAKGEEIHEKIVTMGMLEKDVILGNVLVDMYTKCGAIAKAHQVLKELPMRDVFSWSVLIAGYTQEGQGEAALKCFHDMLRDRHSPDAVTFSCVLKACGSIGATTKGEEIHEKIVSMSMLEKDVVLGNALVDMYAKCGALAKAHHLLKELPMRDAVSWTSLMAGYAQQGQGEQVLKCFDNMLCEGHSPNAVTFIYAMRACGSLGTAAKGEEIHQKIVTMGLLDKNIVLGNTLLHMYAKCGALAKAHQVLKELPICDVVSWNTLITGYAREQKGEEALKCFDDMLCEGHAPNAVTFTCVLRACGSIGATAKADEIHEKVVDMRMLEEDIVLGNTLVDTYAKCGALSKAHEVLKVLPIRDVVSWTALIAGHTQQGEGEEALKCFDDMLCEGHSPNAVTFICALKACGSIGAATKGEEILEMIASMGMVENDIVLGNAMVDMYAKCGALARARQVLKELPMRDVISWTALIAGHDQQGQGEEALKCFDDMLRERHSPNAVTFICVLKACGSIGAAAKGEQVHDKIVSLGMLEKDVVLGASLIDMYVKCGALIKAQQVLQELPVCDAVSWNALISGYAQQGQNVEAVNCFERMQSNGVKPDLISLIMVLNACSHSGLLNQATSYFSLMSTKYGIHPILEHYCCMIDVFARAGNFNKALSVIVEMPYDKCLSSWLALLGACRKWTEVKIGALAFERALNLDKHNAAVYALMADIYAAAGMQEEVHTVEAMRVANKAWKQPGSCC